MTRQFSSDVRSILAAIIAFMSIVSAPQVRSSACTPKPNGDHNISDSYQRILFILSLNPAPWDQVRENAAAILQSLAQVNEKQARGLEEALRNIETARSVTPPPPPDADLPVNPEDLEIDMMPHDEATRQAFVVVTRGVAHIIYEGLILAQQEAIPDPNAMRATARDAFDAFVPTFESYDPKALKQLETAWEQLLLRASGGSNQNDHVSNGKDVAVIADYFRKHFGPSYTVSNNEPLLPIPKGSPTVVREAQTVLSLPPGSTITRSIPRPRQLLNSVERGALEREMILSSLGAAAFNNPYIFGEPARSLRITCNTCHEKSGNNPDFFIPGLSSRRGNVDVTNSFFAPHANNGVFDPLDIPDLRGIRFTAPYGRNGRFSSLREFTRNVIVNEFNGEEPDPVLLDAMVVYMNEFDFVENPALNGDGSLNHRASEAARRGEKLFNKPFEGFGNRSCASCHVPSANFLDHQRHDIGTLNGATEFSRDRALDTPTLLGTMSSAPYFHHGSQPTLGAVVEWFNQEFRLGLSRAEIADLTAYVSTVGNGIHVFAVGNNFVLEDMEDQDSFLAGYEFLTQRRKWGLSEDLFRSIGLEVRRQIPIATNQDGKKALARLAEMMDEAAQLAASQKADLVNEKVAAWRELSRQSKYVLP